MTQTITPLNNAVPQSGYRPAQIATPSQTANTPDFARLAPEQVIQERQYAAHLHNVPRSESLEREHALRGQNRNRYNGLDSRRTKRVDERELTFDHELGKDEIDLEEESLDDPKKKKENISEKSEIGRLRRALERGEKLSASDLARLGEMNSPEARDLERTHEQRREPKGGFTLSPIKLLIRSL